MRDLDAELSRNAEAIKRWERRLTAAGNKLGKLRSQRARLEKRAADHKANAARMEAERREARRKPKQPLPPPPAPIPPKQKKELSELNARLNKAIFGN